MLLNEFPIFFVFAKPIKLVFRRGNYQNSIRDVNPYYRSYSGYNDELVWGALWLYRATGERSYLDDAIQKYQQFGGGNTPRMFSWDDKRAGSQVQMKRKFLGITELKKLESFF